MGASYSGIREKTTPDLRNSVEVSLRIAEERLRLGFKTPKAFADAAEGIAKSAYYRYESGNSLPGTDALIGLHNMGMDVRFIVTGERTEDAAPDRPDMLQIPVMAARPSAGPGSTGDDADMVRGALEVSLVWARKNLQGRISSLRVLTNKGDSMAETIHDGDPLFVDTSITHFDGEGIYILSFGGALLTKRLSVDVGTQRLHIISDNKLYPRSTLGAEEIEGLRICGRVTNWIRMMRG